MGCLFIFKKYLNEYFSCEYNIVQTDIYITISVENGM